MPSVTLMISSWNLFGFEFILYFIDNFLMFLPKNLSER